MHRVVLHAVEEQSGPVDPHPHRRHQAGVDHQEHRDGRRRLGGPGTVAAVAQEDVLAVPGVDRDLEVAGAVRRPRPLVETDGRVRGVAGGVEQCQRVVPSPFREGVFDRRRPAVGHVAL